MVPQGSHAYHNSERSLKITAVAQDKRSRDFNVSDLLQVPSENPHQ